MGNSFVATPLKGKLPDKIPASGNREKTRGGNGGGAPLRVFHWSSLWKIGRISLQLGYGAAAVEVSPLSPPPRQSNEHRFNVSANQ